MIRAFERLVWVEEAFGKVMTYDRW
jgi:hypothetical protein